MVLLLHAGSSSNCHQRHCSQHDDAWEGIAYCKRDDLGRTVFCDCFVPGVRASCIHTFAGGVSAGWPREDVSGRQVRTNRPTSRRSVASAGHVLLAAAGLLLWKLSAGGCRVGRYFRCVWWFPPTCSRSDTAGSDSTFVEGISKVVSGETRQVQAIGNACVGDLKILRLAFTTSRRGAQGNNISKLSVWIRLSGSRVCRRCICSR